MMSEIFITSYCVIEKHSVYKNGKILFSDKSNSSEDFFLACYHFFNLSYPKFYKMDNLSKLGWLASELLLKNENIHKRYNADCISIVLSNSNASLDADIHYSKTMNEIPSPALFVYTLPNIVIGEIAIRNHFKGENSFFISDEFDAALMTQYAEILFSENLHQACICGWVEFLNNDYKCVLFLLEKNKTGMKINFDKENIEQFFANAER
jgi:hypothetical protein